MAEGNGEILRAIGDVNAAVARVDQKVDDTRGRVDDLADDLGEVRKDVGKLAVQAATTKARLAMLMTAISAGVTVAWSVAKDTFGIGGTPGDG